MAAALANSAQVTLSCQQCCTGTKWKPRRASALSYGVLALKDLFSEGSFCKAQGNSTPQSKDQPPAPTHILPSTSPLPLFERQLKGKSFFCTQCGKCCSGDGEVLGDNWPARPITMVLQVVC
jgi:hypothetical protein